MLKTVYLLSFSLKKRYASNAENTIEPPVRIGNCTDALTCAALKNCKKLERPFTMPKPAQKSKGFFFLIISSGRLSFFVAAMTALWESWDEAMAVKVMLAL